ncbi:MAG: N-acetylmuramoyl-L-alanine amidase-like domain-containing protein [Verrucomicrobiota bacterium]
MNNSLFRLIPFTLLVLTSLATLGYSQTTLPFETRFVGVERFEELMAEAREKNWETLPFGKRVSTIGYSLLGIPYENYTLEIDDHIEAPSANFDGMDCWTFFEISVAAARMLDLPESSHDPETFLKLIELDRYHGGVCTGSYLSRLHYLEDWAADNHARGLMVNLTQELRGRKAPLRCREMTLGWKYYRYMRNNPDLREDIQKMEQRVERERHYYIHEKDVPKIEDQIQDGDVIGIFSHNSRRISTSHVGLAYRDQEGTLRFMHATTQSRHGRKTALDSRLTTYLARFPKHAGILVCRPRPLPENLKSSLSPQADTDDISFASEPSSLRLKPFLKEQPSL